MKGIIASGFGGLAAAFGSAVCCSGPLVLASLGLSGAALSAWRPYRPIFVVVAVGLLWLAFRMQAGSHSESCEAVVEGEEGSTGGACSCADPARIRRTHAALILITALSFLLLISPRWVPLVL
ncbi:MAG: mercuric transporter MerT family protein [marine benthic group bacterium]|nr:mercuric transporter MerT family protein [Gemmatimonadota bacterium]